MKLEGSCHCQNVVFSCVCAEPVPYLKCYCSICRKLNGSGGYGINLGADFTSLVLIKGEDMIDVYHSGTRMHYSSPGVGNVSGRHFCRVCSSGLWNWDEQWPGIFHPYASNIDSELPVPPSITHIMLNYKKSWVDIHKQPSDKCFDEYPDESLHQWHQRMGLLSS